MACLLFAVALVLVPAPRPLARDLVAVALVVAYEAVMLRGAGATLGKLAVGLEVRALDVDGPIPGLVAFRRSVPVALCVALALPGTLVAIVVAATLVVSVVLSEHRRGYHDRVADTVVVVRHAPRLVREADLTGWFDLEHQAVLTHWGRAADLTERRRARSARLDDSKPLVVLLVVMAIALSAVLRSGWALAWTTLAWYVAFVIDETLRVARLGATAGQREAGLHIVDQQTGKTPSMGRSFARAVVLGPLLYLPPLQLVLAVWVRGSAQNRGPHDLAGNTIVVEPGYVPPPTPVQPAAFQPQGWPPPMVGGWPAQPGWAGAPQPGWQAPPQQPQWPGPPPPGWQIPPPHLGWQPPPPVGPPGAVPGWQPMAGGYPPPSPLPQSMPLPSLPPAAPPGSAAPPLPPLPPPVPPATPSADPPHGQAF